MKSYKEMKAEYETSFKKLNDDKFLENRDEEEIKKLKKIIRNFEDKYDSSKCRGAWGTWNIK
jgi:hypothetical protein